MTTDIVSGSILRVSLPEPAPVGSVYQTTSATSLAVAIGSKTFVIDSSSGFLAGARVRATSSATGEWMEGVVTSFLGANLVVLVGMAYGTGTHSDWSINIIGEPYAIPVYPNSAVNASVTESHASNTTTYRVKTLFGSEPSGSYSVPILTPFTLRELQTQLYLTISGGANLGVPSATPFRLWFVICDNNGVLALAVMQSRLTGTNNTNEIVGIPHGLISTTAMSVDADSAGVFYSDMALTNVPFVVLGCAEYDSGLTTQGDWTVSPNRFVLHRTGAPLPGEIVQQRYNHVGSPVTSAVTIPYDDTIPQSSEGAVGMSQAIVPLHAANVLAITSRSIILGGNASTTSALFRDAQANALVASSFYHTTGSTLPSSNYLRTRVLAGATTSTTFTLRFGGSSGTVYLNDTSTGMGGALSSYIQVTEFMT